MHVYCSNLMIIVCCIIINSLITVTAGGIKSDLIFSWFYLTAASLLIYGAEDVEELTDAFEFGVAGSGVYFGEGNFGKTGGRGEVSGEAEGTHAAAVGLKVQSRGKCVLWLAWGEGLVVVELEHLLWEGWVIG